MASRSWTKLGIDAGEAVPPIKKNVVYLKCGYARWLVAMHTKGQLMYARNEREPRDMGCVGVIGMFLSVGARRTACLCGSSDLL